MKEASKGKKTQTSFSNGVGIVRTITLMKLTDNEKRLNRVIDQAKKNLGSKPAKKTNDHDSDDSSAIDADKESGDEADRLASAASSKRSKKFSEFFKGDSDGDDVTDDDLLQECYALGLEEKDLPYVLDDLSPPKFRLSLVNVDYVKVMQKALYFSKLEKKRNQPRDINVDSATKSALAHGPEQNSPDGAKLKMAHQATELNLKKSQVTFTNSLSSDFNEDDIMIDDASLSGVNSGSAINSGNN